MKILPFDPKSSLAAAQLDDSAIGNHVRPCSLDQVKNLKPGIVILGLPDDRGIRNVKGKLGASGGPSMVRHRLYRFTMGAPKIPIYDLGDLLPSVALEKYHELAANLVHQIHASGHSPLILGGGHDCGYPHALGFMLARPKEKLAFINVDAHLDVRPTDAGITSGSPWYLLSEHSLFSSARHRIEEYGIQVHCNAQTLVTYAKKNKFGIHWFQDLRNQPRGIPFHFSQLLKKLRGSRTLLSLDIDSVQWSDAPGCSAPQTLGFSASEAIAFCFSAGKAKHVESFGIFEVSPPLDPEGKTSSLAAHCIKSYLQGKGVWPNVK